MVQMVVVGGGFAGCAAALQAARMGARVILAERTDMLCGTGAVGGIMRNNGRYTAAQEMLAMGGGQLFSLIDENSRHKNIDFPGHRHASLFDVARVPAQVERCLEEAGVEIRLKCRISGIFHLWKSKKGKTGRLISVKDAHGNVLEGDVFIDATGSAGPASVCHKYGSGCAVCIMRCPAFGGRKSLCAMCGLEEFGAVRDGHIGAMSGSCKLMKESLSQEIREKLDREGAAVIPVPGKLMEDHLDIKACQQYALPEFAENIILLDTGHAKMMTPFFPLEKLRKIPGLENARYEDPYAGGVGNSIRLTACVKREDTMLAEGMENLFCAGEKSGIFVGHTEAVVTGVLAGFNGVRFALGREMAVLPTETACGDAIHWVGEQMKSLQGRSRKYTFSGSVLFERMKDLGLYTTDEEQIRLRVEKCGAADLFSKDL